MPVELVPFITDLDIELLVDAVEAHGWLYWHPIVRLQVLYLHGLQHDPILWRKHGWESSRGSRPEEVKEVSALLERLVRAHASQLIVKPVEGGRLHGARGQKPKPIQNPHPTGNPQDNAIERDRLLQSWEWLRDAIREELDREDRSDRLKPHERDADLDILVAIVTNAVRHSPIAWSGRRIVELREPLPENFAELERREQWNEFMLRFEDGWDLTGLREALSDALIDEGHRSSIRTHGRPGWLSYVALGFLLGCDPDTVRSRVQGLTALLKKQRETEAERR